MIKPKGILELTCGHLYDTGFPKIKGNRYCGVCGTTREVNRVVRDNTEPLHMLPKSEALEAKDREIKKLKDEMDRRARNVRDYNAKCSAEALSLLGRLRASERSLDVRNGQVSRQAATIDMLYRLLDKKDKVLSGLKEKYDEARLDEGLHPDHVRLKIEAARLKCAAEWEDAIKGWMDSYEQERDRNEDLQEELIHLDRGERRARRWRTAYMTISLALAPFAGAGLVDAARFLGAL